MAAVFLGNSLRYGGSLLAVFFLADFLLLACGVFWLKLIFGYSVSKLFLIGLLPFVPGDLIKAAMVSAIYFKLRPRIKEIF